MIGIFDSGIGGLGTASRIRQLAPQADLIYFGDLANLPYGPKPKEELFELTLRAMMFLRAKGATEFVAACNSVSVSVITPVLEAFGTSSVRMIEMVGPAAKELRTRAPGIVLVAATLATVRSGMYERTFAKQGLQVEMIALPELASAIEAQTSEQELTRIIAPAVEQAMSIRANTLVFGCTQYPFVRKLFARAFAEKGYKIDLFDPSDAVAKEAVSAFAVNGAGTTTFYISKDSMVFDQTVQQLFGAQVRINMIDVDNIVDNSVEESWKTTSVQTCTSVSE